MAGDDQTPKKLVFGTLDFKSAKVVAAAPLVAVPHVHGPGCDHDHGDHGHHHDHAHHEATERPSTARACGGTPAVQLDLAFLLPGETDEIGRFEQLSRELRAVGGVVGVHLRRDGPHLEICVHHEAGRDGTAILEEVRPRALDVGRRFKEKTWFVRGMDCPQCGYVIEHVLGRMPGVLSADVAYAAERLRVEYDGDTLRESQIEQTLQVMGYQLEVPEHGHACSMHNHGPGGLAPTWELPLTLTSGGLLLLGWALSYTTVPAPWPDVSFALALLAAGLYPARGAINAVRAGRVDIEALMVLAAIGAGIMGAWFEGAFLLFLFSLGHSLEHRAMDRARNAVEALGKLRPDTARVRRGEDVVEVRVTEVRRGDLVVVRPGDRVPLDGVVRSGESHVDQAPVTGESVPVPKSAGDGVFSGTLNTDGVLEVEVTKLSTESALARVVDLVAQAESRKSPAQRLTARIERIFVPIVLVGAPLLTFGLWASGTTDFHQAMLRGLSVLVAASPCALAISTPAAVLSAVARAAREGVLIKGGAHLAALGETKIIAFDKTGTLTRGKPELVDVIALAVSEEELLRVASAAEQLSSHPLADAVVRGAVARGIDADAATTAEATHGKGLVATVAGRRVELGNEALMGAVPAEVAAHVARLRGEGRTAVLVRREGEWLGVLGVADTARPEAKGAIAALMAMGITRTVMLSGDHEVVARAVSSALGVGDFRAPLLPEGKVKALRDLQREGPVAMVGDGVNDAPALAAAGVGIAMGGAGSDVALETADVVLMSDDLRKLPFVIHLARTANSVVRQNIAIALGVSALLVVSSIFGWTQISQAVVLHEGSTLIVVANGLRLLGWREVVSSSVPGGTS
jgi:Cd2+/Zn2+-exporting ATPase